MKTLMQDELYKAVIVQELRGLGIKVPKARKNDGKLQQDKLTPGALFRRPLHLLHMVTVDADGLQVDIPRFVFDAVNFLRQHLEVEGLFRKAGSITRQKGLKRILENDGLMDGADAQDVACIVKQFLRELPEPLLVRRLHDAFVGVQELSTESVQRRTLQILCLLLPATHLHTLRYLMLFFSELVSHSHVNKMTVSNLAVVLTPNILVSDDEPNQKEKQRSILLQKQMGLVQLLISNADYVGIVPDVLVERVRLQTTRHASMDDVIDDGGGGGDHAPLFVGARSRKKIDKKRHSINGVFHELRRMVRPIRHPSECAVGGDSPGVHVSPSTATTPPLSVATKRKHSDDQTEWSSSKKRALMQASCLDVPVPIPPQPHFDSPNPVCKEDAVSLTPGDDLSMDQKRKSGRLRIFGKTYLRRRNSLVRTPKMSKNVPSKESIIICSAPAKDNKVVGQRLSTEDTSPAIPVFNLVESPATYLTRARRQERECISTSSAATSVVLSDHSLNLSPPPYRQRVPITSNTDTVKKEAQLDSTLRPNQGMAEVHRSVVVPLSKQSKTKVGSDRRTWNKLAIASINDENDDCDVDFDSRTPPKSRFTRASNGGSTLRRGRPNTVRSGLPVPCANGESPSKTSKDLSCESPCPLLVDAVQMTRKVDAIVFQPEQTGELDDQTFASLEYSDEDAVFASGRKSRRSISLTDIFESVGAAGCLESPTLLRRSTSWEQLMGSTGEGNGEVFLPNDETSCDVGTDVQWSRATVVLKDIRSREYDVDLENRGRPSLIRLKKEKAGCVLASIKRYNDVIAGNVTEPVQEGRENSLLVASPVRIPPIFTATKVVGQVRSSVPLPSSNNKKQKPVSQQKSLRTMKQTKSAQATSTSTSSMHLIGRSRKLGIRSPTTRSSMPRPTTVSQQQTKYAASVRRSPRLHQHQSDRSTLKAKAASDAYRRRAIRGHIKRRSTVL